LTDELTERLQAVNARIQELEEELPRLRASKALLERVLAAADIETGEAVVIPAARRGEPAAEGSAIGEQQPEAEDGSASRVAKSRRGGAVTGARSKSGSSRRPVTAPAQDAPEAVVPTTSTGEAEAKALPLPQRVLAHLIERNEPASVKEIAGALFDEVTPSHQNRVWTAVQALIKKGAAYRLKQGSGVFYQAASADPSKQAPEEAMVSTAAQG
jgi:hypothetical protein